MNFTIADIFGALKACLALLPILFSPGYVIAWAFDVFEFRHRRLVLQLAMAVPLSLAICPILTYLFARYFQAGLWIFYPSAALGSLVLLAKNLRGRSRPQLSKHTSIAMLLIAVWGIIAIGSLIDLQIEDRLYPSLTAYDHSTRVAIMNALARHVPPDNPFFAHSGTSLRYHYFWLLLTSLPAKILHLSMRDLTVGGIIWCGLGLFCAIALGRRFLLEEQKEIERRTLVTCVLLCVTGLDILPILYIGLVERVWWFDMEWWNDTPITSWVASLLWVPHHVAALIACFLGFILLRYCAAAGQKRISAAFLGGIAFASAAGLSIYLAFTFAVAVGLWMLALTTQKRWVEVSMFAGAGIIAALLAFTYLESLGTAGNGTSFVAFAIRPFSLILYIAHKVGIDIHSPPARNVIALISLPINYGLELGLFLGIGILQLLHVRRRKTPITMNESAAWTLVGTAFLLGTFTRSGAIATNDLGMRCFLPAQLILLLWSANFIDRLCFASSEKVPVQSRWARRALAMTAILGLAGTTYQLFMIRAATLLHDAGSVTGTEWMDSDRRLGKRTYALRSAYESLNARLLPSAIIQHNPATRDWVPHTMYSTHDAVAGAPDCGAAFGGDWRSCQQRVRDLSAVYDSGAEGMESVCGEYGIDVMVAKDTDPSWRSVSSWVWTRSPIIANQYVRAFNCRSTTGNH